MQFPEADGVQTERRADQRERLRQQEEQARAREERARQSALAETCRRDAEGRCHWDNKKEALPPPNMANCVSSNPWHAYWLYVYMVQNVLLLASNADAVAKDVGSE